MIEKRPLIIQPAVQTINYKEEIRKFEEKVQSINTESEGIIINFMIQRQETDYRVKSTYIQEAQKNFSPFSRATLMEWIMHVCTEYQLKRDVII